MKKKLFTFLLAIAASISPTIAESGTCGDNLTWDLMNGVLTISGTGAMVDYSTPSNTPWFEKRASITSIIIGEDITRIGKGTFDSCFSVSSVVWNAKNCPTIVEGNSFYPPFENIYGNIASFRFGDKVEVIPWGLCYGMEKLTSIEIPNSVTSIGYCAFYGCSSLTSIEIPNSVTSIGDFAFRDCKGVTSIEIPNSITNIGIYAFYDCMGLTSVEIPNSVTSIGSHAFSGCTGLASIAVPFSVTSIGDGAFYGCSSLTSIEIPNSVTSIGDGAFYGCSSLTSIEIPNSVTSIGEEAFCGCTGLTSIVVDNGNTKYDSRNNCNAIIETSSNKFIAGCKNTIIPNSVTSIGDGAFYGCTDLNSVTIPNSVTSIGNYAFYNCTGLTSVTIPNTVISIGNDAFTHVCNIVYSGSAIGSPWGARNVNGCVDGVLIYADDSKTILLACSTSAEGEIIIPNSVTSIGGGAFMDCKGLTSIEIPNSVTSIGDGAFYYCTGLTSIEIPNSVTTIGDFVFEWCSSLTSVTINSSDIVSKTYTSSYRIKDIFGSQVINYIIGDSVTSIGGGAFMDCKGLTSIEIPNSVTSIGDGAFYGCSSLTSIEIPNSVTSIGDNAFYNCRSLSSVTINSSDIVSKTYTSFYSIKDIFGEQVSNYIIGDSVTSIGDGAFYGCYSLTSVTIPKSVTSIGNNAFSECSHLTSVTIKTAAILGKNYSSISNLNNYFGEQVTEYILGDSITNIGAYAFYDCTNAESIDIPESVTSIGTNAFYRVKNINYTGSATGAPWGALAMNNSPFVYTTTEIDSITSRLSSGQTSDQYYHFSGVISSINEVNTSYGNATFYVTDGTTTFYCYRIYDYYSTLFTNANQLNIGDSVVISSKVQNYRGTTPEATQGRLVYHSANPLFTPDSIIYYGIRRGYSDQLKLYTAIDTDTLHIPESVTYNGTTYTVTEMASGAIYNHQNLKCVVLPKTLQLMPRAFELCDSIETLYYNAENLTKPTTIPFADSKLSLKNVYIGEDVETIPEGIFNNLENISTVHWDATNCEDMQYSPFYYSRTKIQEFGIANNIEHIPANMCWGMSNITEVTIPNTTTYIGKDAFHNCTGLATLYLGENISTYGDSAFANCPNLTSIYNYRERPAKLRKGTFDGVDYFNCTLYVLAGSVNMYKSSGSDWKDFYFVEPIGATSTTTDEVVVTPHDNTADIVWPTISGAASYKLEIMDIDGNLICTLIFNANGQLTSLAFHAPARNNAPQQAQAAAFQFTITGLEIATRYTYTMQVNDASSQVIAEYSGTFGTTGATEIPTGINNISTTNVSQKIMSNGQLFILRGEKVYTATGQEVK